MLRLVLAAASALLARLLEESPADQVEILLTDSENIPDMLRLVLAAASPRWLEESPADQVEILLTDS